MTQVNRMTIAKLAVSYEAFCEANTKHDDLGRRVWGRMLAEAQEALGIYLVEPETALAWANASKESN